MVGRARENYSAITASLTLEEYTIEEYVAGKEMFRVTAHGLPTTLPAVTAMSSLELKNFFAEKIQPLLPKTLSRYSISSTRADFWRSCRFDRSEGLDTLVILTECENTMVWASAVRDVLDLLWSHGAQKFVDKLQVEIRNPQRVYCDVSRALPEDPIVIETLLTVRPQILKLVQESMPHVWTSIGYHLRVNYFSTRHEEKPSGKPTIIVFCKPGVKFRFDKVEDEIMGLLKDTPMEIHVEFLPGSVTEAGSQPRRLR